MSTLFSVLVTGCWLKITDSEALVTGCLMQDTRYRMPVAGWSAAEITIHRGHWMLVGAQGKSRFIGDT